MELRNAGHQRNAGTLVEHRNTGGTPRNTSNTERRHNEQIT